VKDLLDEGGEFYATVDGRDVEVGGKRIVRGRVRDISFEVSEEVASITIETAEGEELSVGGRVAALEDIEAHEIRIGRNEPPTLEDR
jgi:molybdopterin-binding protein